VRLLERVLSSKNFLSVDINSLGERFSSANYQGKKLLIFNDTEMVKNAKAYAFIKEITGNSQLHAEIKGRQELVLINFKGIMLFISNHKFPVAPALINDGKSFLRRNLTMR
jgi:phage/plasmid-associated DNA primase